MTGLGFLVLYAICEPVKLTNEKIWAKLAIVWVLSVNGVFIHAVVLPRIEEQIGKPLFLSMSNQQRHAFLASGAISVASWYVPVALGALVQFNFTVPASAILVAYLIIVCVAIVAVQLSIHALPAISSWWQNRKGLLQSRFRTA